MSDDLTDGGATPVISQYLTVKAEYQDCLLFFRMGDFYELFFDDAVTASKALDIVLTKRGKYRGEDIPMCGVPAHNYENYAEKLVRQGRRIAICEQVESPEEAKKRGGKSVVRRQVTRILTPGTVTEDHLLPSRQSANIVILYHETGKYCLFRYDLTSGKSGYAECSEDEIERLIYRIDPAEILYHGEAAQKILSSVLITKPIYPAPEFADNTLAEKLWAPALRENISPLVQNAFTFLCAYISRTQGASIPLFQLPVQETSSQSLILNARSMENLEIFRGLDGNVKYSLFHALDNTVTPAGGRLLRERISSPLTDPFEIENRADCVAFFLKNPEIRGKIRETLKKTSDTERVIGRVKLNRASPSDLGALRDTLENVIGLRDLFSPYIETAPLRILEKLRDFSQEFPVLLLLTQALKEDSSCHLRNGTFIREGFDALLDEYADLKSNGSGAVLALEAEFRAVTGVLSLKIKHNFIIGYHIDVPAGHSNKLLSEREQTGFIHKQTLANSIRFTHPRLIETEKKISEAEARFQEREKILFTQFINAVLNEIDSLLQLAGSCAEIDLYVSHAQLAEERNYHRPVFTQEKRFHIENGRHPVAEIALRKEQGKCFTPNDCDFHTKPDRRRDLFLLTGPNMGGKSTYLRQNALMIIAAQAGLYVSADHYSACIFDRLFSRIGASDNIARGESTFMTEMSETAQILKNATGASFVILDELGRGTAACDGLAIALAVTHHLVKEIRCMTLFATHYHELAKLTAHNPRIGALQMKVSEFKKEIIFLHQVGEGAADRSYGLHVAALAGLPLSVLKEADIWAERFENRPLLKNLAVTPASLFNYKPATETAHENKLNRTQEEEAESIVP